MFGSSHRPLWLLREGWQTLLSWYRSNCAPLQCGTTHLSNPIVQATLRLCGAIEVQKLPAGAAPGFMPQAVGAGNVQNHVLVQAVPEVRLQFVFEPIIMTRNCHPGHAE